MWLFIALRFGMYTITIHFITQYRLCFNMIYCTLPHNIAHFSGAKSRHEETLCFQLCFEGLVFGVGFELAVDEIFAQIVFAHNGIGGQFL